MLLQEPLGAPPRNAGMSVWWDECMGIGHTYRHADKQEQPTEGQPLCMLKQTRANSIDTGQGSAVSTQHEGHQTCDTTRLSLTLTPSTKHA